MTQTAPDERSVRTKRLEALIASGVSPYPSHTHRTHTCNAVQVRFDALLLEALPVTLVGRIRSLRRHGGSTFGHLQDETGQFQLYAKRDVLGNQYSTVEILDVGDFIEASGRLLSTKRGEQTLLLHDLRILAKALRPLPEKWHGLTDVETRYRKRELDMLSNATIREIAVTRARTLEAIRFFFRDRGFLEVETPILQPTPGGATAKPFVTHHEALDANLYLRIAPELYLKRLLVGGFERVFEVSRCFRNEGIDRMHNPEFTMLEAYEAYADYGKFMSLTEALIKDVLHATKRSLILESGGQAVDFTPPYMRMTFSSALKKYAKIDPTNYPSTETLAKAALERRLTVETGWGRGKILDEIYRTLVRPALVTPTFLTDHPVELSPLAKRKPGNEDVVERFQLIACGIELVNAFSELNDPLDQRRRFEEQERLRLAGDEEAHRIDEDYLEALEYGMPPAAGIGIGIDRLVSLLTNASSIKEVILFPTLRTKTGPKADH